MQVKEIWKMKTSYEILGIEQDADKTEIKKAYSKLIRKYRPETDPEKFMEIRKAYESLTKGHSEADTLEFSLEDNPEADRVKERIEDYLAKKEWAHAIAECQKAMKRWPDCVYFSYLLTQAYRGNGNTGKAVTLAEKLSKNDPNNRFFVAELGRCYRARKFNNKAFEAMRKAYGMGAKDMDFIKEFYEVNKEATAGAMEPRNIMNKAMEIYGDDPKYALDILPMTKDEWNRLNWLRKHGYNSYYYRSLSEDDYLDLLEYYAKHGKILAKEIEPMMPMIGEFIADSSLSAQGERIVAQFVDSVKNHMDPGALKKVSFLADPEYKKIMNDPDLSSNVKKLYEVTKNPNLDQAHRFFLIADKKLCMIEDIEDSLDDYIILKKRYPSFAKEYESFFALLTKGGKKLKKEEKSLKLIFERHRSNYDDYDYGRFDFQDMFDTFMDLFYGKMKW